MHAVRLEDSTLSPILTRLWYEGDLELGMEGVDDLALPSKERPLVTGHAKARLAAISELAKARSPKDLPDLLLALRDPAIGGARGRARCSGLANRRELMDPWACDPKKRLK